MLPGDLCDFSIEEVEERLSDIFEGYLGADTGSTPEELQLNHHLIRSIIRHLKEQDKPMKGE